MKNSLAAFVTTGFATLPLPVVVGNDLSDSVRDIRQTRGVLPVDQFLKDRGAVLVVR